jgi:hypothetical protein
MKDNTMQNPTNLLGPGQNECFGATNADGEQIYQCGHVPASLFVPCEKQAMEEQESARVAARNEAAAEKGDS